MKAESSLNFLFSDIYRHESGRCCTPPFFLMFFYLFTTCELHCGSLELKVNVFAVHRCGGAEAAAAEGAGPLQVLHRGDPAEAHVPDPGGQEAGGPGG